MTADLSALVYVRVCLRVCPYVCVCEVLCLKRMNHLLCHLHRGRRERVMFFRQMHLLSLVIIFSSDYMIWWKHQQSTEQSYSNSRSLTATLMCDSHNKHLCTHSQVPKDAISRHVFTSASLYGYIRPPSGKAPQNNWRSSSNMVPDYILFYKRVCVRVWGLM